MKRTDAWYDKAHAHLMALPIDNPERNKLRDVVKGKPEQLHKRARRFLTLGAEYAERETFAKRRHVIPTFADWLVSQGWKRGEAERFAARENAAHRELAQRGEA